VLIDERNAPRWPRPLPAPTSPAREAWVRARARLEAREGRYHSLGQNLFWDVVQGGLRVVEAAMAPIGLRRRGVRNALDVQLRTVSFDFDELPSAFDGFTILHLSDLHLDVLPGATEAAIRLISSQHPDLCVVTGDYRGALHGPLGPLPLLEELIDAIDAPQGVLSVLGNHDPAALVPILERLGVRVLINESMEIARGDDRLCLTGTDDPEFHHSPAADRALWAATGRFRIALVHSPELTGVAAAAGYQLYLTGHTHGGQILLPGCGHLLRRLLACPGCLHGKWQQRGMAGYTSSGIGVSLRPMRFNSRGEVAMITLRTRGARCYRTA
jgi:predicted MPP superfamily phosphohydrolase